MEFYESFKEHIKYRLSNPFTPAFILAWVPWNYRVLLLLFSDYPAVSKVYYITWLYDDSPWYLTGWMFGLVYPLLSALAFVLISPLPAGMISAYWAGQKRICKGWVMKAERLTPVAPEELQALYEKHEKALDSKHSDIDKLEKQLESEQKKNIRLEASLEQEILARKAAEKVSKEAAEAFERAKNTKAGEEKTIDDLRKKSSMRDQAFHECFHLLPIDLRKQLMERPKYMQVASFIGYPEAVE